MKKIDPRRGILIALVCVFTLLLVGELALVCLYTGESSQGAMAAPADTVSREQARRRDFAPSDAEGFTPPQAAVSCMDLMPLSICFSLREKQRMVLGRGMGVSRRTVLGSYTTVRPSTLSVPRSAAKSSTS